jgi:putative endonuclease
MTRKRQQRGQYGEDIASTYLSQQGYRIVQRNYRNRYGEIDIIAWDDATLVFVEVKTTTASAFGVPQEKVGMRKQQKLTAVAMAYVMQHHIRNISLRFDVISVTLPPQGAPDVAHIHAAFHPSDYFSY